jgi:hypothetical protein
MIGTSAFAFEHGGPNARSHAHCGHCTSTLHQCNEVERLNTTTTLTVGAGQRRQYHAPVSSRSQAHVGAVYGAAFWRSVLCCAACCAELGHWVGSRGRVGSEIRSALLCSALLCPALRCLGLLWLGLADVAAKLCWEEHLRLACLFLNSVPRSRLDAARTGW